ncbi:UDP-N-acetylmuramoyl-L-alanine--D-glutamate ligase [Parvularcula sp. ZS-1/3]|uniref:UDP-N-acetylmuramoyl-L-alanine--D-glutamate ligase n=1 Tax=Parvularcula mediterranea TaxID=2732508 RepID=A0A7Y3RMC2_9PROT|nr:UDP-N-acetylmuramoyl-L-alanine--D-glutamate ligase [Parvularcula mediterranea]NNU16245.1 UDP-N-acetylmuramoyl-L-alanine--D-glutamate ligase [Parvularcula mediterranea]
MTKVLLHGAGTEAQAAARYFARHTDDEVSCFDDRGGSIEGVPSVSHDEVLAILPGATYLRSPGVPPTNEIVAAATDSALRATTPTGLWLADLAPKGTVTITGTKGKSTTTALTTLLFKEAGLSAAGYGNIGEPPLSGDLPQEEHPILELSSYMMHDLPKAEHLHIITCLFEDHLTWHGSREAYHLAKLRPFLRERPAAGWAPQNVIDRYQLPSSVKPLESVAAAEGVLMLGGEPADLGDPALGFQSGPLRQALVAAIAAGTAFLSEDHLREAVEKTVHAFTGLPHRQEIVPTKDGRLWIDDTLATIPEATLAVLARFAGKPVALILGGADRGIDYAPLNKHLMAASQVTAIGYGEAAQRMTTSVTANSLEDAIAKAEEACPEDGVILFSPAAPSEPPHADYKERSAIFRRHAALA